MHNLQQLITHYLDFSKFQKKLNEKSLKAYRIDLAQYADYISNTDMQLNRSNLTGYISTLHQHYKPKSAKRKIARACLKKKVHKINIFIPFSMIK